MEFFKSLPLCDIHNEFTLHKNLYIHCYVSNGFSPSNALVLLKPFVQHTYSYFVCHEFNYKNNSINLLGYNGPNILEELFPPMYRYEIYNENVEFRQEYKSSVFKKIFQQIYKHKKNKQFILFSLPHGHSLRNKYIKHLIENRDLYNLSIFVLDKEHYVDFKKYVDYAIHFNLYSSHTLRNIYRSFFDVNNQSYFDNEKNKINESIYHELLYEYRGKYQNTYFIYKKNIEKNTFDFMKYEFCENKIQKLCTLLEKNEFRLSKNEIWEKNKYIDNKNKCFQEMIFLFTYKNMFQKYDFTKLNEKYIYKNIFIGKIKKSIFQPFLNILDKKNISKNFISKDKNKKNCIQILYSIYKYGLKESKKVNNKNSFKENILYFKNIHKIKYLFEKTKFKELFYYNKSLKTNIYIYQKKIIPHFFSNYINLNYYSKCMNYLDFFNDSTLFYSDINYIIIDIKYILNNMKLIFDELFHIFIPYYNLYQKLINHFYQNYTTIILHYNHYKKESYDFIKDISTILFVF